MEDPKSNEVGIIREKKKVGDKKDLQSPKMTPVARSTHSTRAHSIFIIGNCQPVINNNRDDDDILGLANLERL